MSSLSGGVIDANQRGPTASETALSEIALARWNRSKKIYHPTEGVYKQKIEQLGSPVEAARARGLSAATLNSKIGSPVAKNSSELATRELGRIRGLSTQMNQSDLTTKHRAQRGAESVIGLGLDVENTGISGFSQGAQLEQSRQLAEMQADAIRNAGLSDAAGTAVGYGLYGMRNQNPPGFNAQTTIASDYDHPVA